jgi:hypothetical protein
MAPSPGPATHSNPSNSQPGVGGWGAKAGGEEGGGGERGGRIGESLEHVVCAGDAPAGCDSIWG